ncbi:hypothetical protein BY996DRAFT_6520595 [Phakopsora pachyrhizi]|nr:hypothetical protein BY996DRAFT_6520595 [Phakopsora pachyrhizi]
MPGQDRKDNQPVRKFTGIKGPGYSGEEHLPAGLPEEIFWKTLSPWIDPISNPDSEDKASLPPRFEPSFDKPDLPVDSEKLNEDEDLKSTPLLEHLRNARKAAQEASIAAKKQQQQQRQASSSQFSKKSSKAIVQPQIMKRDLSLSSSNEQKPERDCSQANKKPSSNDQFPIIPNLRLPNNQRLISQTPTPSNKLLHPNLNQARTTNQHTSSNVKLADLMTKGSSLKMVESTPSSRTGIDERIENKSYAAKGPSSSNSNSKSNRGCKDSRKKSMRTSEDGGKVQVQENNKKNIINSSKSVFNGKNEQSQSSAPHINETSKRSGGNKLAGDAAAGARRSLGMALAGISGSKPERKKRSDVNDSKPAVLQE